MFDQTINNGSLLAATHMGGMRPDSAPMTPAHRCARHDSTHRLTSVLVGARTQTHCAPRDNCCRNTRTTSAAVRPSSCVSGCVLSANCRCRYGFAQRPRQVTGRYSRCGCRLQQRRSGGDGAHRGASGGPSCSHVGLRPAPPLHVVAVRTDAEGAARRCRPARPPAADTGWVHSQGSARCRAAVLVCVCV